ncbi:MAG: TOBE domain-containing protein [Burkholderiales bacterium]|nr:TOBE domain-containing protein [Burkholderiales bacterium]
MFRPEDLQLAPAADAAHFSALVLASLFQGDHTRLELDLGTGRPIVARLTRRRDFAPGERLHFSLTVPATAAPGS